MRAVYICPVSFLDPVLHRGASQTQCSLVRLLPSPETFSPPPTCLLTPSPLEKRPHQDTSNNRWLNSELINIGNRFFEDPLFLTDISRKTGTTGYFWCKCQFPSFIDMSCWRTYVFMCDDHRIIPSAMPTSKRTVTFTGITIGHFL